LITWLTEETQVYHVIKAHISAEDFAEGLYRQVAQILFKQLEEGTLNPAQIVSCFTNEEEQREVAALFNTKLDEIESKQEREKALKDIIIKVKKSSLERRNQGALPEDMDALKQVIADKRAIEELAKLHISLD
jgi:DNA primase